MDRKIIMIHQPDFLPWIGFFHKFLKVDAFILLDHVTNHPKARNWLRRVKIIVNGEPHFLSLPLKKHSTKKFVEIYELEVNKESDQYQKKLFNTIDNAYRRAPFFNEIIPVLDSHFSDPELNMKKWNMKFISTISEKLGIKLPEIIESSSLGIENSKTEMLAEICEAVGATHWLHTGGVEGYFEEEIFTSGRLQLFKHEFTHPIYPQFNTNEFVPGLSIIDVLMNVGFEETRNLILKA